MLPILLLACLPFFHDYHASITDVCYRSKKHTIEVISRVYIDDLERALKKHAGKPIKLDESRANNAALSAYFLENFKILNSKKQALQGTFVGKKIIEDRVELYVEFPAKGYSAKWSYINLTLTEIFDNQNNTVNCFYDDESISRKTTVFMRGSKYETLP